jgi:glycosyltransferase involved in cell wall biosynthesis
LSARRCQVSQPEIIMDISFSTPSDNLKIFNGYGHASLKIMESLKRLGHNVTINDPNAPVQLNFSQPTYFKFNKNQYQIGYTPWESTEVPSEWKLNMLACDEVWTTSDWCKKVFEENGIPNVKVYPVKRKDDGVIRFLHIGEPAPRKAGQMVVDAFVSLYGNNHKYSLTIKAYNNNTTRVYNNYIDKNIVGLPNEIYNNINLITEKCSEEELVDLYHQHDVLVYPTYGEGFGFIPLQALATGMPVISTHDWCHYENYLGPLKLKSELIESPWHFHNGKVFEPNQRHLAELMKDVSINFKAYSGYFYAQSTKIHEEYNWDQLTNKAFEHIFKKFA